MWFIKSERILHNYNIIVTIKNRGARALKLFIFERCLYSTGNGVPVEPRLYFYFLMSTELLSPYEPVEMSEEGILWSENWIVLLVVSLKSPFLLLLSLVVLFCLSCLLNLFYSRTAHHHFFFFLSFSGHWHFVKSTPVESDDDPHLDLSSCVLTIGFRSHGAAVFTSGPP